MWYRSIHCDVIEENAMPHCACLRRARLIKTVPQNSIKNIPTCFYLDAVASDMNIMLKIWVFVTKWCPAHQLISPWCHLYASALFQVMACCLFGTKPLAQYPKSRTMLTYCQLDTKEQIQWNLFFSVILFICLSRWIKFEWIELELKENELNWNWIEIFWIRFELELNLAEWRSGSVSALQCEWPGFAPRTRLREIILANNYTMQGQNNWGNCGSPGVMKLWVAWEVD